MNQKNNYLIKNYLEQSHFLREALEFEVVRQLTQIPNEEIVSQLREIVAMQEQVSTADSEDIIMFAKLDELFHRSMFTAIGHESLYKLVRSRSGHMDRVRRLHLPSEGKIRSVLDGHKAIIDAIESGSQDKAFETMRDHLAGTISRVRILRDEFPEYFN